MYIKAKQIILNMFTPFF